ncbi:hypothetical protein FB451DRAFT_1294229 [Mycena latifolia]|nr:hypothetical protein FB451DRAFT_1294229 [Mycena latifolia]
MHDPKVEKRTESPETKDSAKTRDAFSVVEHALAEAQRALADARTGPRADRLASEKNLKEVTAARDALQTKCNDLRARVLEVEQKSVQLQKASTEQRKAMAEHAAQVSKQLDASKLLVSRLQNELRLLHEHHTKDTHEREALSKERTLFQAEKQSYETKKKEEEEHLMQHHRRTSKMLKRVAETLGTEASAHDLRVASISGVSGTSIALRSSSTPFTRPALPKKIRKAPIKEPPKKKSRTDTLAFDSDDSD